MKKRRLKIFSKIVMLIFAVYAAMTLLMVQAQLNEKRALQAELEQRLAQQKITNAALSEAIASEPDESDMERIARDKLGLIEPGEIVFVDISR